MEEYFLKKDITVMCVTASSFPEGVMAAHEELHSVFGSSGNRRFFGISHPDESGNILYKAAAEQLNEAEAIESGYEIFTIKKGTYYTEFIPNFCDDVQIIGKTFQALLKHPRLYPQGYCLEIYESDTDVRCLVPLIT
ncbi:MAG: hypothetical protein ABIO46_02995 [Chitinophagales bacterium]